MNTSTNDFFLFFLNNKSKNFKRNKNKSAVAKADEVRARPWVVHQLCPNRPANKNKPKPKQLDENMWTVILLMKIQVTETHAQS